jgi:tetraacyldisaccharide 4'-kinase
LIYYLINFIWDIYWRLKRPVKVSAKVISIGNLSVGGSGKTSLVAAIARKMQSDGLKLAVVARGYGRPEGGPISFRGSDNIDWHKTGDEPAMLAKMIPGLKIYVDSSKTEAAKRAAAEGNEYIIIDDGFQHRKLYRDIDILCISSNKPFGNGLLLPSGILREPKRAIKRADIMVAFGDRPIDKSRLYNKPVFRATRKISSIKNSKGVVASIAEKKLVAFCGLGNPDSFRVNLGETGCKIAEFIEYRDHYVYNEKDISKVTDKIKNLGADGVVTTLKDYVKIESLWPLEIPIYCLEIAIELENVEKFYKLLYDSRI